MRLELAALLERHTRSSARKARLANSMQCHCVARSGKESLKGVHDPTLRKLGKCANGDNDSNICRKLHRMLSNSEFTLQVEIGYTQLDIKHPRKRHDLMVPWPTISLTSWLQYIMQVQGGQLLLQGHHINQPHLWREALRSFWSKYESVDPLHPVFQDEKLRKDLNCTIPYLVHGDEGRGRMKQPILVIAFQGVLSHLGIGRLNESGYL